MRKFLLGLLCGLILAFVVAVILVFSAVRLADRRPAVADNSVLLLRLEGQFPERPAVEIPLPAFEGQANLTVRDVWSLLKRAATDSKIKAVVIAPRQLQVGWAKSQELRESLVAFKKSGKPLYALLRFPSAREYYIATAADKIFSSPEDIIDVKGLRIEVMYLGNTMNKIGADLDVVHAGKYKDALDTFTRSSMSPETREVLNQILDQQYANFVETIAQGRKMGPAEARLLIDRGPFIAKDALASGLVDALGYEDQVITDLQERVKQQNLRRTDARDYVRSLAPDASRTKIALLVAQGTITQGSSSGGFGADGVTSGGFTRLLRRVKNDNSIKGVILRVDSPGGDAIASDDILHEMKMLSQSKPVVISMSDVAASGGYYMSVTGDPIVAYPSTITGSIGVITAHVNLRGFYDKIGVTKELLTRGRFAALDSDYTRLTEPERAKVAESVDAIYRGFVSRVAEARKKSYEEVDAVAQGRVWLGQTALDRGLVDKLGGLDTAVEMIRERAKIADNESIALVPYPPRRSLFEMLMSRSDETALAEAKVNAAIQRMPGGRWIQPLLEGGTLALMPYFIEIK
jgi:protease IV